MPQPVIANGGWYGSPGVSAAGHYGATPADMLYSLRNNGWTDQQILSVYGPNDPMVRIMQLENRWNQTRPNAQGYRYQQPQRRAAAPAGPGMNTMTRAARSVANMVPGMRQQTAQRTQPAAGGTTAQPQRMTAQQTIDYENALEYPTFNMPDFGSFAPGYDTTTADGYFANPTTRSGMRIRPWTNSLTYGGSSLPMPDYNPDVIDTNEYARRSQNTYGPQDPRNSNLYNALQRTFASRWNQINLM